MSATTTLSAPHVSYSSIDGDPDLSLDRRGPQHRRTLGLWLLAVSSAVVGAVVGSAASRR